MRQLAIDAGQSGVRTRLLENDAFTTALRIRHAGGKRHDTAIRADEHKLRAEYSIRTDLPLVRQVADVVSAIAANVGGIDSVAVGLTGFTGNEDLGVLSALAPLGVRTVIIAHDSTTSYLGALGAEQGAVVASGTGVVTLAVGAQSVARVDGWGNIMGDAGSGYWFGRAALDAAMRAYDGRGSETVLLDRLREEFGNVERAYIELQSDPSRVRRTASFSRWVTEADSKGDVVAGEICRRGAAELAHSVASALDRVRIDRSDDISVCTIGGVFNSQSIVNAFVAELSAFRRAFRHVRPRGNSLDGAAELFSLEEGSPLEARVTRVVLPEY